MNINQLEVRMKKMFPNMNNFIRESVMKKIMYDKYVDRVDSDAFIKNMTAAWIRHNKTKYDDYMDAGMDKQEARAKTNKLVRDYIVMYKKPRAPWARNI